MYYFQFNSDNGEVTGITECLTDEQRKDRSWQCRADWSNERSAAHCIAVGATKFSGELFIASDSGPNCYPRYDVVKAPKVGDEVSYAFNGDYYPDGVITSITKDTLRVIKTSTGSTYYKRKDRAAWIKKGGTWSLIQGHVNERNPCF